MCERRAFLKLAIVAIVATVSGLGAACGVKGPLYLPQEPETEEEKDKDKDEDKTSKRSPTPRHAANS